MKHLLMVKHASGKEEIACPQCGNPMIWREVLHEKFEAGEYSQTGYEYLECVKCDAEFDLHLKEIHKK